MKTLTLEVGRSLFDELEVSVHHEGLPHPITVSGQDFEVLKRNLERQLVVTARIIIRKFITTVRKSRTHYIPEEVKVKLEALEGCIGKLNSRTRLATFQMRIQPNLPDLEFLLPRRRSRLYPSQMRKVNFIEHLVKFRLEELDLFIHDKTDGNVK